MTTDRITLTIQYSSYDYLADIKKDLQKYGRGKIRIDFDHAIQYLKAKAERPETTALIFVQSLIKEKRGLKLEHQSL